MELKNLKVSVIGDSITEGVGVSAPEKRYFALLAEKYGWKVYADGISGTRITPQKEVSGDPRFDLDFCGRVKDLPGDSDLVLVFGGTNDFGHGLAPFGKWEDTEPATYCGALYTLMRSLAEKEPAAVRVIMTPLHRFNDDDPCGDVKPAPVGTLYEYVDMMRRRAEQFSMPVCDLFANAGLVPKVPCLKETYVPDGLHPNDAGHRIIAARLENFLLSL